MVHWPWMRDASWGAFWLSIRISSDPLLKLKPVDLLKIMLSFCQHLQLHAQSFWIVNPSSSLRKTHKFPNKIFWGASLTKRNFTLKIKSPSNLDSTSITISAVPLYTKARHLVAFALRNLMLFDLRILITWPAAVASPLCAVFQNTEPKFILLKVHKFPIWKFWGVFLYNFTQIKSWNLDSFSDLFTCFLDVPLAPKALVPYLSVSDIFLPSDFCHLAAGCHAGKSSFSSQKPGNLYNEIWK